MRRWHPSHTRPMHTHTIHAPAHKMLITHAHNIITTEHQQISTKEELLETVVAIEEELLHISAPSRLDYFKSGHQFADRVNLKRKQLSGEVGSGSGSAAAAAAAVKGSDGDGEDEAKRGGRGKRQKV